MKKEASNMEKIFLIISLYRQELPESAILDVIGRIADWVTSGNSLNEQYVKNQYLYLEKLLPQEKLNELRNIEEKS